VYNRAHLKQLSVHPASHILLTKKCPQIEKNIQNWNALCPSQLSHPFKVWQWVEKVSLPNPLIIIFTRCNYQKKVSTAILREISAWTSYSIVRLVFRPYTHIWQTICTSVLLRTSIRVSPDFILHKYSSPSFGSQHIDYKWHPSKD